MAPLFLGNRSQFYFKFEDDVLKIIKLNAFTESEQLLV